MELFGLIVGLVLVIGGYERWEKEEPKEAVAAEIVTEQPIVSVEPLFERGRYYRTKDGYYISNLTPAPQKVDGCDRPVLTADLTAPRGDGGQIQVTEVDIECEG